MNQAQRMVVAMTVPVAGFCFAMYMSKPWIAGGVGRSLAGEWFGYTVLALCIGVGLFAYFGGPNGGGKK